MDLQWEGGCAVLQKKYLYIQVKVATDFQSSQFSPIPAHMARAIGLIALGTG